MIEDGGTLALIDQRVSRLRMIPGGSAAYHFDQGNYFKRAAFFAFDIAAVAVPAKINSMVAARRAYRLPNSSTVGVK